MTFSCAIEQRLRQKTERRTSLHYFTDIRQRAEEDNRQRYEDCADMKVTVFSISQLQTQHLATIPNKLKGLKTNLKENKNISHLNLIHLFT